MFLFPFSCRYFLWFVDKGRIVPPCRSCCHTRMQCGECFLTFCLPASWIYPPHAFRPYRWGSHGTDRSSLSERPLSAWCHRIRQSPFAVFHDFKTEGWKVCGCCRIVLPYRCFLRCFHAKVASSLRVRIPFYEFSRSWIGSFNRPNPLYLFLPRYIPSPML